MMSQSVELMRRGLARYHLMNSINTRSTQTHRPAAGPHLVMLITFTQVSHGCVM